MRRKLIETLLPVAAISAACVAEAKRRSGNPSQLHPYWARRPLALARATILAQTLDDPESQPDRFPTPESQATERARLVDLVARLAAWDPASSDDATLSEARAEMARHLGTNGAGASAAGNPIAAFHDPFAGGAIAIEAQRLGLDAHASDLNPLAALISTVAVGFAPTFGGWAPVGTLARDAAMPPPAATRPNDPPLRGLALDVVQYGAVLFHLAQRRLGHLYPDASPDDSPTSLQGGEPTPGTPLPVIAWIWARTVPSPNPAFAHVHVPLMRTFILDARPAEEAHLTIDVDGARWTPRIVTGPPKDRQTADLGTRLDRADFRCVLSGTPITREYLDHAAAAGRLGARLVAVVAARPDGRHAYLAPDDAQVHAATQATRPEDLPDISIRAAWGGATNQRTYGLDTVGDLFTDRQALTATTLCDLVGEVRDRVRADAVAAGHPVGAPFCDGGRGADAYADAVATLLSLAISRYLATGNALAQWDPKGARVRDAFARLALVMAWDFAEVNPFVSRAAGLRRVFTQVADGLNALPHGHGHAFMADARTAPVPAGAIITADPPYYDLIQYADLSEFFYAWLRRPLRHIHPDLFATLATPRGDELVVDTRGNHAGDRATTAYEDGLADAFRVIAARARPDVPLTCITTVRAAVGPRGGAGALDEAEPAYASLAILVRAGLQITALWPLRTDPPNVVRFGSDARPATAVVAARRRAPGTRTISVREFVGRATPAIAATVARLRRAGVAPTDLLVAALGPGLEAFTSADAVIGADGQPLSLGAAVARSHTAALEALEGADAVTANAPAWMRLMMAMAPDITGRDADASLADRLRIYAFGASPADLDDLYRLIVAPDGDATVRPDAGVAPPGAVDTAAIARTALEAVADLADGLGGDRVQALGPVAPLVRDLTYRAYARAVRFGYLAEARAIDDLIAAWPPGVTA